MRAVKTWPRRRQVLGALRRAPRCSSRRRTRAAAASNVLAALRMLVERCAPHTALAGQRKRLDWHRRSEPNWLTVVRPSRLLPGEPASYDRPALPAPKAPLLRPYLAGNPPRFRLDRRQVCCCGVGASGRQPGARPPSLATRVLLYAWDHHAAPLPRQLSLNIRRVCALPSCATRGSDASSDGSRSGSRHDQVGCRTVPAPRAPGAATCKKPDSKPSRGRRERSKTRCAPHAHAGGRQRLRRVERRLSLWLTP
jgi:hypothetical protein